MSRLLGRQLRLLGTTYRRVATYEGSQPGHGCYGVFAEAQQVSNYMLV